MTFKKIVTVLSIFLIKLNQFLVVQECDARGDAMERRLVTCINAQFTEPKNKMKILKQNKKQGYEHKLETYFRHLICI